MPYLRELEKTRSSANLRVRIIVAVQEDLEVIRKYLRFNEMNADAVVDLRSVSCKLQLCAVPYVLLVDESGRVMGNWQGMITFPALNSMINAVQSVGASTR